MTPPPNLRTLAKMALSKLGAHSSEKTIHYVNGLLDYVEMGWWLRRRGLAGRGLRLPSCFDVPCAVASEIGDAPVLYLQFGAEDPAFVEVWARALRHPDTRLNVFDAGDPYAGKWLPSRGRGHLWESPVPTEGAGRKDSDPRIAHFSGDFREQLARLAWPANETTVVAVFDTDRYTTTKAALDLIAPNLPPHSYLFFDQLNHRADELRAFHEFLEETGKSFDLFAGNRELSCIAFRTRPVQSAELQ